MKSYDLLIIGAGPGGYVCAIRAAQLGLETALVEERGSLGGTCLNIGCIPSKALLESSELYAAARHGFASHGINTDGVALDLSQMMTRKDGIVKELVDGVAMLMKKNKVTVHTGRGALTAPGRVSVQSGDHTEEIAAGSVCLAMGSDAVELPFAPFDGERIVSSTEALSFAEVPGSLVVIGAGAVGLELGSVWGRLGSRVSVIEMLPSVAPFADKQMAGALERALAAQGLEFHLESRVTGIEPTESGARVCFDDKNGSSQTLECDKVLVAVGRRPRTGDAGIEEVGIALDEQRRIVVDEHFRTNVEGVYAIGDLVPGPMLAHKAEDEGIALAELLAGRAGHVDYRTIPNVIYTEPELAMVGQTEAELKEAGVPFSPGRFLFRANGRAKCLGLLDGMVKILAHGETDEILGVHMVGPRVSELIAEAVLAMEFQASAEDLARTCHAHPTLSEVVREAALAVEKRAIHS
jgi:dihydrolipoamide dehydrogenase